LLLGIEQKTKQIRGKCEIRDVVISGNKTTSVVCNGVAARVMSFLICECDSCKKEFKINKRGFFSKDEKKRGLCEKCTSIATSLEKYGTESPNQSAKVKAKQQKTGRTYIDGHIIIIKKTNDFDELCKLRSVNTKKKWENGDYNHVDWIGAARKSWNNPIHRQNHREACNRLEVRKIKSEKTKEHWLDSDYRQMMSKIGIRMSKFQLTVYETLDKNDWQIEYPVPGTTYTVDFFNLKTNEIIECCGDYWHCNPNIFEESFYNKRVHKTAKQIWNENGRRIKELEDLGYKINIVWESDFNSLHK
jgi:G:T-mismatch repair DNA endonuclease (very short patch repair protein)